MSLQSKLFIAIAALFVIAQLATPLSMVYQYHTILEQGTAYRFEVEPIDPADPFKGRYVRLSFPISQGRYTDLETPVDQSEFLHNDIVYLLLSTSDDNRAIIQGIVKTPPDKDDYVKARILRSSGQQYRLSLPFNRYYADEFKAPKIESLVWQTNDKTYVITADIRIKDGKGVIKELYVDETPILEYLRQTE